MGAFRKLFGRGDKPAGDPVHDHLADPAAEAPGWDAIDRALAPIYGDQEPKHYGTLLKYALGGPDPIDGLSIYRNDGDPAHWHYVSYGLSELYRKTSDVAEVSGWGIELTFRLRRDDADEAPIWPMNLMQNLARYVFDTGNVLLPNHHLDANGPIALETPTELTALLFIEDPELRHADTPNGHVQFVQLVGITADELAAIKAWSTASFVDLWRRDNALVVTDLARRSLLSDPQLRSAVAERTGREGSTLEGINVDVLSWSEDGAPAVTLGAMAVPSLRTLLSGRVARGQEAWLRGPEAMLVLRPGEIWAHAKDGDRMVITMPRAAASRLSESLAERAGTYMDEDFPGLTIVVQETVVTDQKGEEVGRIG